MSWKSEYIFLIIFSTLVDFYLGKKMGQLQSKKERKPYLLISLFVNLGLLFSFKYFNFFADSANAFLSIFYTDKKIPLSQLLLPVGISFYTFQTISYSIDVYNEKIKPELHLGHFALYVSFFPQLVAGPIERFTTLSPQLKAKHKFELENFKNGFRLILYGLFIKMVIADNLSPYVDLIYENPTNYKPISLITGVFFYSFQIYSDFYGYSLIAIGTANLMGISLMDNFKTPYLSKNISEFWQRWHISLSTWFKDYLYFPLGGSRTKKARWMLNISIVFIMSGIWHGANWTFIFWGFLYALVYLAESHLKLSDKLRKNTLIQTLLVLKTFILVSFIWVFFRSQTIFEAFDLLKHIIKPIEGKLTTLDINPLTWLLLIFFIILDSSILKSRFDNFIAAKNGWFRWSLYTILISSILMFSGVEDYQFIYFQF